MAFDESNDYNDFEGIGSGENGTIEGLIEVEGAASAFRYRKVIQVVVMGEDPDDLSNDIKGNWKVRIRENSSRNEDGSYAGAILFEQEVFWTADVTVASPAPGLNLITWTPLGPAGSGQHRTSVCNGESCPIIENISAPKPGELEAYKSSGAWRFLDAPKDEDDDAIAKYDIERGYSDWDDEGVASSGGYTFFAEWYSANYLCEFPEGAIFETVYDRWQVGSIDSEAAYQVSIKPGAVGEAWLADTRTGARWFLFLKSANGKKNVKVIRSRQQRSSLSDVQWQFGLGVSIGSEPGVVEEGSQLSGMILFRFDGGALVVMGAIRSTPTYLRAFISADEGKNWRRIMNTPLEISPLAMCAVRNGARVMVYGVDASRKPAYAILAYGQVQDEDGAKTNGWKIVARGNPSGSNLFPVKGTVKLEPGDGGAVRLLWRDDTTKLLHVLVTTDDGKTYKTEALS